MCRLLNNEISRSAVKNHLRLFTDEGEVKVKETREFLSLSMQQLADVFGLTLDQVRETRMSDKVKEKIKELAAALEFVAETFDGNATKTKFWIKTPNPNFGGSTPLNLIIHGKHQKVLNFILAARKNY